MNDFIQPIIEQVEEFLDDFQELVILLQGIEQKIQSFLFTMQQLISELEASLHIELDEDKIFDILEESESLSRFLTELLNYITLEEGVLNNGC